MSLRVANQQLNLNPVDRLSFQWMLEQLMAGKPSFRFLKAQLGELPVYIFTRHQKAGETRLPSLFIMAPGWQDPIILSDESSWRSCYQGLASQHSDAVTQA